MFKHYTAPETDIMLNVSNNWKIKLNKGFEFFFKYKDKSSDLKKIILTYISNEGLCTNI